MQEANPQMIDMILLELPNASERDLDPYVKEMVIEFNKEEHTYSEKYDFIVEISELPCTKLSNGMCAGDISTFVRELCALNKYYTRPL